MGNWEGSEFQWSPRSQASVQTCSFVNACETPIDLLQVSNASNMGNPVLPACAGRKKP